jgi:hypothetical protein
MSEYDDRDEPATRYTTVAIVLAVVFLTVLGAGVGLVLAIGSNGKGTGNDVANETSGPSLTPSARTGTDEPYNGGTNTRTRTAPPGKSYPPTRKDACPKQSEEAAGTPLTLLLFIRTARSEVWICQGQGRTFYQGHVRGGPFTAATSDNTIFITNVRYEAGVHAATNGDTVYYVSAERLRILTNGQEKSNEPAEESYPA